MTKRFFLFALLALVLTGAAFTQNNWISAEIKGPGVGLRYEYVITPYFTVGGYFSYTIITIPILAYQTSSVEFGGTARLYPFGGRFFFDLSIGYNTFTQHWREERTNNSSYNYSYSYDYYDWFTEDGSGLCLAPGFGWTIDVGKMGGFFLSPGAKFPLTLGDKFNITIAPYFGLGFAF